MKKLLSIILALTMVIALVPSVFAEDTDGLEYNFNRSVCGLTASSIRVQDTETSIWYAPSAFSDIDTTKSAQWRVGGLANVNSGSCAIGSSSLIVRAYENSANKPSTMSVALNVTTSGWVKTNINFNKYKASYHKDYDGYTADIWLVKMSDTPDLSSKSLIDLNKLKEIVNGLDTDSNAKYLGQINTDLEDTADGDSEKDISQDLKAVELTSGEYQLIINAVSEDELNPNTARRAEINSFTLTPIPEDPISEDEFDAVEDTTTITSYEVKTVSAVAYTVGTDAQDSNITVEAKENADGTYTLNAPTHEGYNFLYWKKGLTNKKDVITYKPTDFVYAPTAGENNYVIAVYEKIGESTANKAEFYNANGQFIKSTDGAFPEGEEIPSMAGYGDATGWQCYTDGKTYELTDSVTPDGIMLFVADYEDTLDTVNVNGTGVPYGTEMSFTATPVTGKTFKCWTRTDEDGNTEIVSIEENYKFRAYENCTITEVDTEGTVVLPANTRKIVLDTFSAGNATALMAEFIGLKNDTVVEKGIMFGNNRIAMKSTGTQFTIIPDETGTYKGYAIVKEEDNSYTLITDGEYPKQ